MKKMRLVKLPPSAQVRGNLYDDPTVVYESGDVFEVELPTGLTIDVGWDASVPNGPFRIVVYRDYFGDRFVDYYVQDIDDVIIDVERLAQTLSRRYTVTSCSDTESRVPAIQRACQLAASVCAAGTLFVTTPGSTC